LRGKKVRCKNCGEVIAVESSAKARGAEEASDEGSGRQERIQPGVKRPNRALLYDDDEERPRRRERDDSFHPRRKSNSGLIIGLIVGGVVLLLLLAGGAIVAAVLLLGNTADQPPVPVVDTNVPWPQPRPEFVDNSAPPDTVVVHVTGISNEFMSEAVQEKLGKLADDGQGQHLFAHTHNGRTTVRVSPVNDPKAFAAKIDFGTVNSVKGRTITMAVGKLEGVPGPDADGVTKALFELKSSNVLKRHEALRKLKGTLPDQRRAEVCKALEPLMNDSDHFTREWSIETLGIWGTKETVPILLKAMNDNETRSVAIKALGRLKDERAIEPIADRLEEFFDRRAASEALKQMGPAAEDAVLKRLNHPDDQVCMAACDILKAIGTKRSLPALEKLMAGGNFLRTGRAKKAIQAITARQ
jgi:hypothetical protein